MGDGPEIRTAGPDDAEFLTNMLVEAANWPSHVDRSRAETLADPAIAHYVAGWPKDTDLGVVAIDEDRPVGAAWLRLFSETEPGYGFVAADVPELAIGVVADRRGRGVGRALLRALADTARLAGIESISLSVERANRAIGLYRAEGYRTVATGDHADTMLLDLR
jgi:ribosomal protein S18 acetylase RimI-like enzyme